MRFRRIKKVISILTTFLFIFVISPSNFKANSNSINSDENIIGVTLSPPFIKQGLKPDEKFSQHFLLKYENIKDPTIEIKYQEADPTLKKKVDSSLLQSASSITTEVSPTEVGIDVQIDTQRLSDKTYYFIIEIILIDKTTDASIVRNIAVGIPIILTMNKTLDGINPKPEFLIKPHKKIYFTTTGLKADAALINQTEKTINIGAEVIVSDRENNELYAQSITPDGGDLFLKSTIKKEVIIPELPNIWWKVPYIGKVDLSIRATINNERHIQTKTVSIWVIPYQIIITVILILLGITLLGRRISRKRKRNNKTSVIPDKE